MKYTNTNHTALVALLEKASTAIISPEYANTKGFEATYIGTKCDNGHFLYQFEDGEGDVWDCGSNEIDEIEIEKDDLLAAVERRFMQVTCDEEVPEEAILKAINNVRETADNWNDSDVALAVSRVIRSALISM